MATGVSGGSVTDLDDSRLRTQVLAIPTAFRISDVDRGMLRQAAKRSVERSAEFKRSWSPFRRRHELSATSALPHPTNEACLLAAPNRLAAT